MEKTSTEVIPAELILNYSIRLSSNILAPIDSSVDSSDTSLSDRMDEWISRQHTLLIVARDNQQQSDQHRLVENDAEITDNHMSRRNKLQPKHKEPYQVIGHEHYIYIIEDLIRGKRIQTHIHNLRPFIFDLHHIDPMEIAQQNEQEFQVRKVVVHRDNHRRRSTMKFPLR